MATSKLTSLAEQKTALGHKTMSKDATVWLQQKISELKRGQISQIPSTINREKFRQMNQFRLGMMYCFYYDAKTKADLPYWDRFPMVLVLERYNDGFLGLNIHYLPVKWRIAFMSKLMRFAQLTPNDDIQRMRISYDILNATKKYAEFKPCLKRYLHNHIRSKMLMIQPNEWDVATLLPIQQFRGAKPQEVWNDSLQQWKDHMAHFNQEE